MEGDVAVFESHENGHHEFRSKNYWAYDLRPGLSAHAYLRQKTDPHRKPTACLPADGKPPQEQYHIIPLMGLVHEQREIPAELRGITGPGDALPVAMTVDALGNMFAPDENYVLQPTGGLVHIIEAAAVTPADRARQQQLLTGFTATRPQWLVGAEVHKRFEEWGGTTRSKYR